MKESNLLCQVKCKWIKITDSRHHFPRYPNLIKRLNRVWLSDITYIRIRTGFVYFAAILDAYSSKVIGYAISMSLDVTLTLQALKMAIAKRQPGPGLIHHLNQGYSTPQVSTWTNSGGRVFLSAWHTLVILTRTP